ncbi:hypothetical protein C2E23DRAFT_579536 [Lenzites betulinus]|nr:hypothetical protein C2E23DRAFT_579536 [Lenzites betulinus]
MYWGYSHIFSWAFLATFSLLAGDVYAGNTTCASGQLDWYTSVVGESPCVTYQRLRQICNSDYQVPSFRPNTPGDNCDDQVSACCCNTVAFQLSMLCMNCQQDHLAGDQIGIDAGVGAYTLYRGGCGAGTNNALPSDIQKAVCNQNIRLDNFVYGGWSDGSWFYVWTRENAEREHAANNDNTFTHCPNQISPSITPTPATTNANTPAQPTSATPTSTPSTSTTSTPDASPNTSPTSPTASGARSSSTGTGSTVTTSAASTSSTLSSGTVSQLQALPNGQTNSLAVSVSSVFSIFISLFRLNPPEGSSTPTSSAGDAPSSPVPDNNNDKPTKSSSDMGAIIGGAVGGVSLVAVVGILFLLLRRCRTRRAAYQHQPHVPRLNDVFRDDEHSYGTANMSAVHPGSASTGMDVGGQREFLVPATATETPGRSAWSDFSSDLPQSTLFTSQDLRHTDAGVLVPLQRSSSGRLPPAYRSWEDGSSSGSEVSTNHQQSEVSGETTRSGVGSDAHTPLVPLRGEKDPDEYHLPA